MILPSAHRRPGLFTRDAPGLLRECPGHHPKPAELAALFACSVASLLPRHENARGISVLGGGRALALHRAGREGRTGRTDNPIRSIALRRGLLRRTVDYLAGVYWPTAVELASSAMTAQSIYGAPYCYARHAGCSTVSSAFRPRYGKAGREQTAVRPPPGYRREFRQDRRFSSAASLTVSRSMSISACAAGDGVPFALRVNPISRRVPCRETSSSTNCPDSIS